MSIHMSDLSINVDQYFSEKVLEIFGIEYSRLLNNEKPKINKAVTSSAKIREVVMKINKSLNSSKMHDSSLKVDMLDYKDYLFKAN